MKFHRATFAFAITVLCFRCPSFAQIERPILSAAQVPFYPHMARAARVQGAVFLNVTISPTGGIPAFKQFPGVLCSVPLQKKT
jgi:hypothetical protein